MVLQKVVVNFGEKDIMPTEDEERRIIKIVMGEDSPQGTEPIKLNATAWEWSCPRCENGKSEDDSHEIVTCSKCGTSFFTQFKNEGADAVLDDGSEISIKWSYHDVLSQAKEDGEEITDEQAKEILAIIKHQHDASIGINWEVISTHISMRDMNNV